MHQPDKAAQAVAGVYLAAACPFCVVAGCGVVGGSSRGNTDRYSTGMRHNHPNTTQRLVVASHSDSAYSLLTIASIFSSHCKSTDNSTLNVLKVASKARLKLLIFKIGAARQARWNDQAMLRQLLSMCGQA